MKKLFLYLIPVFILFISTLLNYEEGPNEGLGKIKPTHSYSSLGSISLPKRNEMSSALNFVKPVAINSNSTEVLKSPLEVATEHLNHHPSKLNIQEHHRLVPKVFPRPNGYTVHFSVYENSFPIEGIQIQIEMTKDLKITGVLDQYAPLGKSQLNTSFLHIEHIAENLSLDDYEVIKPDGRINDYPTMLYTEAGWANPEFAYVIKAIEPETNETVELIVSATDGTLFAKRQR